MLFRSGLLVGGAMLAAVACGGGDDDDSDSGDAPAPTATTAAAAPTSAPAPTTPADSGDDELITAPDTSTPAGTAVIAVGGTTMGSENGRNAAQSPDGLKNVGIAETLFRRAPDDSHLPWIASDFEIAPDLSSATVTIQSGIPFQVVDGFDAGNQIGRAHV